MEAQKVLCLWKVWQNCENRKRTKSSMLEARRNSCCILSHQDLERVLARKKIGELFSAGGTFDWCQWCSDSRTSCLAILSYYLYIEGKWRLLFFSTFVICFLACSWVITGWCLTNTTIFWERNGQGSLSYNCNFEKKGDSHFRCCVTRGNVSI